MFVALGLLVFPSRLDDVAVRGTVLALVLVFVARPVAVAVATLPLRFRGRAGRALGALACAAPCPSSSPPSRSSRRAREHAALRRRLLRRAGVDPRAGHDLRAGRALAGRDDDEPALPRPLAEAGTIRRLGAEVLEYPVGRGRRGRGRARARPRAAARGGGQRHRARRRGDPAARLDLPARRRSPPRAAAHPSSRATCSRSSSAGARGRSARRRARRVLMRGRAPLFSVRRSSQPALEGDAAHARARSPATRWSRSCGCAATCPAASSPSADGRYAVVGPLVAVGSRAGRGELGDAPPAPAAGRRRRARVAANVVGALAAEVARAEAATAGAAGRKPPCAAEPHAMRNRQLHDALAAFAEEAAWQLAADTADGAEVSFEVVASGRRDSPLYCYRPLTAAFIDERVGAPRAAASLPARGPRALGTRRRRPLPRGARRARVPGRAAGARGVRAARLPRPRLRGLDRLRARARPPASAPTPSSSRRSTTGAPRPWSSRRCSGS